MGTPIKSVGCTTYLPRGSQHVTSPRARVNADENKRSYSKSYSHKCSQGSAAYSNVGANARKLVNFDFEDCTCEPCPLLEAREDRTRGRNFGNFKVDDERYDVDCRGKNDPSEMPMKVVAKGKRCICVPIDDENVPQKVDFQRIGNLKF